ncbi:MAG: nuclear transport factor 2 family protein [Gammaproteobacteria bacterium]|nr:nuclear transport factor 2 family protein [Gammaproteobacteria bacterium]
MSVPLDTPETAQQAFYTAFAKGDMAAMTAVWARGTDTLCVHPTGDALRGEVAIDHSWAGILAGGGAGKIEFEALNRFESANLAVFTGYEHITPRGSRIAYPPVLATNIYRYVSGSWQMVSHHASPIMQGRAAPTPEPNRTRH